MGLSEIPRWLSYSKNKDKDEFNMGQRQSITETFISRYKTSGGNIIHSTRDIIILLICTKKGELTKV
jgi:hypothetical protein